MERLPMQKNERTGIFVTVACAFIVALTSILSSFIAREKVTTYQYIETPSYDDIKTDSYFPLYPGNYWVYKGTALRQEYDKNNDKVNIIQKNIELKVEVKEVYKNSSASLYIMSGHPSDANFALYDANLNKKQIKISPSKYGYLVLSNKIFTINEMYINKIKHAIGNNDVLNMDSIGLFYPDFEFPLFKGQKYGDPSQLLRTDLMYYWYVNDKFYVHDTKEDKILTNIQYEIILRVCTSFETLVFQPFLGIVTYKYIHNGTRAETSITLSDYKFKQ